MLRAAVKAVVYSGMLRHGELRAISGVVTNVRGGVRVKGEALAAW